MVVLLGPEDDRCTRAMGLMKDLTAEVAFDWTVLSIESMRFIDADISLADETEFLSYSKSQLEDMACLLIRPWFSRLWVRQEI